MDLTFDADEERFRSEARAWLAAHVPTEPLPPLDTPAGLQAHRDWEATLFAARWSVVNWPVEFGGRDAGMVRWLIFEEEYARARAPVRVSRVGISVAGAALLGHGRAAQKERFLPPMAVRTGDLVPRPGPNPAAVTTWPLYAGGPSAVRAVTAGSSTERRPRSPRAPSPNGASASSAARGTERAAGGCPASWSRWTPPE